MKKVLTMFLTVAILLSVCPGVVTVTEAKSLSELQRIPLSYLDSDSDWKAETDANLASPAAFSGVMPKSIFAEGTKVSGGNEADPISDAKAADDVYFKLENIAPTAKKDCYIDIINSRSPKIDRYELKTGNENVITLSMDIAIPSFAGDGKNIYACETNTSTSSNSKNKWETATGISYKGVIGNATLNENQWYNITYEIGGENQKAVKYFVDGVQVGETALTNDFLGLIRTGVQANAGRTNTIYYDNIYLNVGEPYSEARFNANRDASVLNFNNFCGDNDAKDSITDRLNLARSYDTMNEETSIVWSADSDAVNCETGEVTRGTLDKKVKLTATITNGECKNTKTFELVVKAKAADPAEIAAVKDKIRSLIEANEDKTTGKYSEKSIKVLEDAKAEAEAALENSDADMTMLYAVMDKLVNAVDNLVLPEDSVYGAITNDANTQKNAASANFNLDVVTIKAGYTEEIGSTARLGYIGADIENISEAAGTVYLKLYMTKPINEINANAWPISIYKTSQFDETTLTYNNRPMPGELIDEIAQDTSNTSNCLIFDVTDYVTELRRNGQSSAWIAVSTAGTDNISNGFYSKEAADEDSRPAIYSTGINIGRAKDADLNAIDIKALINDADVNKITKDLNELPKVGSRYGHKIVWTSSNPDVISSEGKVTIPAENTAVTLTAAISEDGVVHSRSFELTVRVFNEIESDCESLTFDSIKGGNTSATAVITNLSLISKGANGSPISWSSSDKAIIADDGTVVRDALSNAKDVTFTATIGNGDNAVRKDIAVRVYGDKYTVDNADETVPVEINGLAATKEQVWRYSGYSHKSNGLKGAYLLYKASENCDFVVNTDTATDMTVSFETSADGVNYTPFTDFKYTKTAKDFGIFGGHSAGKYVSIKTLPQGTKFLKVITPDVDRSWRHTVESVEIFKNDGEIKFEDIIGNNYNAETITESLVLPQVFGESTIAWTSSNPELIAADGTLSARPGSDTNVSLTAVITNGERVTKKVYNVTVKAYDDKLTTLDIPLLYYLGGSGGKQYVAMNNDRTISKNMTIYSTVDVLNISNKTKNVMIVTALYSKDGILIDSNPTKIEVQPSPKPQTITGEIVPQSDVEGIYKGVIIKSFVWEDGSFVPICDKYSITLK